MPRTSVISTLDVRIRALLEGFGNLRKGVTEIKKVGDAATRAGNATGSAAAGTDKFSNSTAKAGQSAKNLAKDLKGTTQSGGILNSTIGKLVATFGAFIGVLSLASLAKTAARAETLGITLGVVGRNAGFTTDELAGFEKELRGLGIATIAARDSLTQLIQAGINLSETNEDGASKAAQLARAAQDLAVVSGESSSRTLQRLIVNINQLDTVGLRFLGITVSREEAFNKLAASLNVNANALTGQQQKLAITNIVLEKTNKLAGAYEESLQSVGKQLGSLQRQQEDFAIVLGNSLQPAFLAIVRSARRFLSEGLKLEDTFAANSVGAKGLGDAFTAAFDPLGDLFLNAFKLLGELLPTIALIAQGLGEIAGAIFTLGGDILGAGASVDDLNQRTTALGQTFKVIGEVIGFFIAGIQDGFAILKVSVGVVLNEILDFTVAMIESGQTVANFFGTSLPGALTGAVKEIRGFQDAINQNNDAIFKGFENNENALARFEDRVKNGNKEVTEVTKEQTAAYTELNKAILLVARANTAGASAAEVATRAKELTEEVKRLGAEGQISAKDMATLNRRLTDLATKAGTQVPKALKQLGLSQSELTTGLSAGVGEATQGIGGLIENLKVAVGTLPNLGVAFTAAADKAKSLTDVSALFGEIRSQSLQGVLDVDNFGRATETFALRFNDIFTNQLKTAKTEEDFIRLGEELAKVGDSGLLSAEQIKSGFDEISLAAKEAGSNTNLLQQQLTSAAQAQTGLANQRLAVTQAEVGVARAGINVTRAQNEVAREGTALARAKLNEARAQQGVAQANLELAKASLAQEAAGFDLLIAKQRELNAEKEAGRTGDREGLAALQAQTQAATAALAVATQTTEKARQNSVAAQQTALEMEIVRIKAEEAAISTSRIKGGLDSATNSAKSLAGALDGAGDGLVSKIRQAREEFSAFSPEYTGLLEKAALARQQGDAITDVLTQEEIDFLKRTVETTNANLQTANGALVRSLNAGTTTVPLSELNKAIGEFEFEQRRVSDQENRDALATTATSPLLPTSPLNSLNSLLPNSDLDTSTVQSIADAGRTVRIELNAGDRTVPINVSSADEADFIELLRQAGLASTTNAGQS